MMKNIFIALRSFTGLVGLGLALERMQPVPTISVRGDVYGGKFDRNPPVDPRLIVSLQNASFGALVIHSLKLYSKGKVVNSFHEVLGSGSDKYVLGGESDNFFKTLKTPKAIVGDKELITVRPKSVKDEEYFTTFCKDVSEHELEVEIVYSASSNPFLSYLTTSTRKLSVVS